MKKLILIAVVACIGLCACRKETIPVVSVDMLPTDLVGLCADTTFDTIPYSFMRILVDTIQIDTFYVDTFFVDTIRLCANVSYEGDQPIGPSLQVRGFYANDSCFIASESTELATPAEEYGGFSYVLPARNTDTLYVYSFVVNPFGTIRSHTHVVRVSDFDPR